MLVFRGCVEMKKTLGNEFVERGFPGQEISSTSLFTQGCTINVVYTCLNRVNPLVKMPHVTLLPIVLGQ